MFNLFNCSFGEGGFITNIWQQEKYLLSERYSLTKIAPLRTLISTSYQEAERQRDAPHLRTILYHILQDASSLTSLPPMRIWSRPGLHNSMMGRNNQRPQRNNWCTNQLFRDLWCSGSNGGGIGGAWRQDVFLGSVSGRSFMTAAIFVCSGFIDTSKNTGTLHKAAWCITYGAGLV